MKHHLLQRLFLLTLAMLAWHGFSAPDPASPEKARRAMATLQSSAPSADKALACKQLAVYGTAEAVPALAPLLHDEQLAAWARTALEAIPGPAADQALRDAAGQLQGRLLVGVINSLGVRRDAQAVRMLISRLRGDDEAVASAAALALGRIGGDAPARILQRTLTDSRASVRSTAAQGCILCGEQFFAQKEYAKAARFYDAVRQAELPAIRIAEATRGAILARFHDGIPLLIETLRSPDQALWAIGLSTARELPGQVVTEELAVELRQTPTARQVPLLLAIADRHDEAAADVLLTQARDGEKHLRLAALAALGRLGSARATPVLLQAVGESDPELAQTAITTLAGLPADEVDPLVATRLRAASGNARLPLIRLAGQRRIAAATSDFIEAAGDADAAMRAAGLKALGDTAGVGELNALTDLLGRAKSEAEIQAVQEALETACARIPDKAACAAQLLPRLNASSTAVQCALLRVFVGVGTPATLESVQRSVAAEDPQVRDAAVRALTDWPDAAALPALLDVWRKTTDDSHRFLALRGGVRLLETSSQSPAAKVKTFGELLAGSPRPNDRKLILSGIANVADPGALSLVTPLLAESAIRAEAELAALKIAESVVKTSPAPARSLAEKLQAESGNPAVRERAAKLLNENK